MLLTGEPKKLGINFRSEGFLGLRHFFYHSYLTQVKYVTFGFSYFVLLSLLRNFEKHCLSQQIGDIKHM